MNRGFSCYDPIAETYAAIAEPAYFEAAAADLVSALELRRGVRLLDVGAGTGVVTRAASRAVNGDGLFIASDPAVAMLRVAASRGTAALRPIASALPRLPFRDRLFDVVTASFVLSHVTDPADALREMRRTLAGGGKLGLAGWAQSPTDSPPAQIWQEVVDRYVDRERIAQALASALPSEGLLSSREELKSLVIAAGYTEVAIAEQTYEVDLSTSDFVQARLMSLPSRFMRTELAPETWDEFVATVSRALEEPFGDRIRFDVSVHIATAVADSGEACSLVINRTPR